MPAKKGAGAEGSAGGGGGGRISAWKPTQAVPRDPPLLEACKTRRAADALKLAEEDGVDVNVADEQGFSALMWSSFNDKFEAVAARLVDAGAKLNAVSTPGGTSALVFACERGHAATALMLVEKGAKLNIMGCSGKTALDYADEKGSCAPCAPAPRLRRRSPRIAPPRLTHRADLCAGLKDVADAIRAKGGKTGLEIGPAPAPKK